MENRTVAAASYGAGTRVAVHRSRFELERTLGRYGASDFALVEADASASIEFAMQGRFVQLVLPLPDANDARFTQTPSGRPRTVVAQERAYEQALREHWRGLLLAVRGKLQSVESGISTFEHEFAGFLVSQTHAQRHGSKKRKKPKAVNWLLGSSHTLAIALVAAFLVPASAVGAFALPPNVVDNLSAPFRSALSDEVGGGGGDSGSVTIALGSNSWAPAESESDFSARRRDPASRVAPEGAVPQASDHLSETALPSAGEDHVPAPSEPGDAAHAAGGGSGSQSSQQTAATKPDANPGGGANSPAAPQSGGATSSPPAPPDGDEPGQAAGPSAGGDQGDLSNGEPAADGAESPEGPTTDDPDNGNGNGNNGNHGNGNNGNGNGNNENGNNGSGNNGNGNGNQNESANSSGNSNASSGNNDNGNGNGNGNGNANGNNANANGNSGNANANGNSGNANGNASNGNANGNSNANSGNNGNANGNNGNANNGNGNGNSNANSGNNGNANGNNGNANGNNGNGNGNASDPGNPGKGKAKAAP